MKLELSRQAFEKYINIKFHENPYSGSPFFPFGRMDGQDRHDTLIDAFRNFANALKNGDMNKSK